jgi:hypothetical protein
MFLLTVKLPCRLRDTLPLKCDPVLTILKQWRLRVPPFQLRSTRPMQRPGVLASMIRKAPRKSAVRNWLRHGTLRSPPFHSRRRPTTTLDETRHNETENFEGGAGAYLEHK